MIDNNLDTLALEAWKDGRGDAMTAVKLLRDRTGLHLVEAVTCIEVAAAKVGSHVSHTVVEGDEARELFALFGLPFGPPSYEQMKNDPRLAAHRAARGVRKVRGAK
jgi:hypothetical protein